MVSVMVVLTIDLTRVVFSKRWLFYFPLGFSWLLVFILVRVASSLRSWAPFLVVSPLSRIPFGLVFSFFSSPR